MLIAKGRKFMLVTLSLVSISATAADTAADTTITNYQQALVVLTAELAERQATFSALSREKRDRILSYAMTMVDVTPQMFDSPDRYRPVVDQMTADYERFYLTYSAARSAVATTQSHVNAVEEAITKRIAELTTP